MSPVKRALIVTILCAINAYPGGDTGTKRPFSIEALQYLLDRNEFDRFDFYLQSYLRQHPDTAELHLIRGDRILAQARAGRVTKVFHQVSRTGGLPRKYPLFLSSGLGDDSTTIKTVYDAQLVQEAVAAYTRARSLDPDNREIAARICRLAAEADMPDLLYEETRAYIYRFGCDTVLSACVVAFSRSQDFFSDNSAAMSLLRMALDRDPGNTVLRNELGRLRALTGTMDTTAVGAGDFHDRRFFDHAIRVASAQARFARACSLAVACHNLTHNPIYLEQATLFALTFDSSYAHQLRQQAVNDSAYSDSLSLSAALFTGKTAPQKNESMRKYFLGDLVHLNFPLLMIYYRRDRNTETYYHHKASLLYAFGMHDSAAYYNLNLLRTIRFEDARGIDVLFNLAAEYYAAGNYRLSCERFLELYRYYNGRNDPAVRYGLGLNYEQFGDMGSARYHYRFVANHPDKRYKSQTPLQELAKNRLREKKAELVVEAH